MRELGSPRRIRRFSSFGRFAERQPGCRLIRTSERLTRKSLYAPTHRLFLFSGSLFSSTTSAAAATPVLLEMCYRVQIQLRFSLASVDSIVAKIPVHLAILEQFSVIYAYCQHVLHELWAQLNLSITLFPLFLWTTSLRWSLLKYWYHTSSFSHRHHKSSIGRTYRHPSLHWQIK